MITIFHIKKVRFLTSVFVLLLWAVQAQSQLITLRPDNLVGYGVTLQYVQYHGEDAVQVFQAHNIDSNRTFALVKGVDFHNGTIELLVAGKPKKGAIEGARGFVGVSFRVSADTSKSETLYIRPSNGRANDQVRRNHALQYISHPGFPWEKLRKETPEKYESYADIVPGEWTRIKIEVQDDQAKLYVNGNEQPNLIVNDLKQGKDLHGGIGLWIAIGTEAYFSDLRIVKRD